MGRISNYQEDSVVGPKDKVVGSELIGYNSGGAPYYKTRNFTMFDIQTFVMGGNFTFSEPINIVIGDDGIRNWSHNNITVSTPSAATSTLTHSGQFTVVTGITTDNYTEDSLIVTKGHVKQINTATYTLPDYKFNIAADSNPGSHDAIIDINSSSFDTLNVLGGAVLTSKITAGDTITIDHSPRGGTDATANTTIDYGGTFLALSARTITSEGHWSDNTLTTYTLPTYSFNVRGDNTDATQAITNSNTLIIAGTTPISTTSSDTDTVTITHDDITHTASTSNSTLSYSGTFTALTARTVSAQGHLTASTLTTYTLPAQYFFSIDANATVANTPAFNKQITSGQTLNILGGTNLGSTVSANDTVTINHDAFSTSTSAHSQSPASPGFGGNFTVLSGLTVSNGHVTDKESIQINIPSLPTYNGDDISVDTGALSGATVISDLDFNVTTNTLGHVTDANGTVSTRELTLADLGYTGATDANNYVLPTDLAGDDIDIDTTALTGATIISDLDINITTDTSGRVTDANGSVSTRELTLADLGYTGDTDAKNHQTAAELRTAIGTGNNNLVPAAGTAGEFLKHDGTFGTTPYTTYSANSGVDLAGTVFSLDVTSTTANSFFQVPFFNSAGQALSRDASTSSSIFFNPNSNTLSVKQISIGTTSVINTRSIFSQSGNTSGNYFEIRSTMTNGTGGSVVMGVAGAANRIYSYNQTGSNTSTRKFEIVTSGGDVGDFVFNTNGDMTVSSGDVNADNFCVSSDRRLKSEIEPIKEGLEVIKKFSSYNYIKSGKKESGFIAQEVKEVLPHTVYENEEGMLSMSDRGVLAHMHKAILELEERLFIIEEKLN